MSHVLNIGQMDKRVLIESYEVTAINPSGQKVRGWNTQAIWWCNLTDDSSGESSANNQLVASVRYTLRGRFISGIKANMRINDGGIYYNIIGVRKVGRDEQLIITAEYKDSDQSNM